MKNEQELLYSSFHRKHTSFIIEPKKAILYRDRTQGDGTNITNINQEDMMAKEINILSPIQGYKIGNIAIHRVRTGKD